MSNQVFGPFTAITVVQGVTPANATWGSNAQKQASVAINSLNADFSGPFVHSGITCARNGVTLNQLDVTSGIAYLAMSDLTVAKIAVGPSSAGQFVTVTPSTTYYLFLKNDGTWQWSTTSTAANAIPIAQATTDGSGNINVVTDVRQDAGSPGIPYTVGRALNTLVTATTQQNILIASPHITGFYRANLAFTYQNPTPQKVIAKVNWTDPTLAVGANNYFREGQGGLWLNGSQAATTGNNQAVACEPLTLYASSASSITVQFQDPGGTPNCHVSALVERIG